ncbi:MAG: FecR domain-containing protein [Candidatus Uhrbacteria bacterium]
MKTSHRATIVLFVLMVTTLLVGQRFGFAWAGGSGYVPSQLAGIVAMVGTPTVDHAGTIRDAVLWKSVARGETVRTIAGQRVKLQIALGHSVSLDENTDVTVEENDADGIRLKLLRGRVYADATPIDGLAKTLSIDTLASRSTITTGAITVVNYDFLWKVSIAPIDTEADVVVGGDMDFPTRSPMNVNDATANVIGGAASFNMSAPDVADFYAWVKR